VKLKNLQQKAGKGLADAVVICKLCRLAMVLQLFSVQSSVYKWSTNPFTYPNPAYSHTYYVTIILFLIIGCETNAFDNIVVM
jgi:hypothetical protein